MSTAMVSLGIATGFERRYGVLKRLGSTPLSRGGLLAAKTAERARDRGRCRRSLIVGDRDRARLGARPAGIVPAIGLLLIGTVAFAGIGMLMAGHAARRGEPRRRQRAVPRAAVPRRDGVPARTSCPTRSRSSPRRCPAAALVRVRARRARRPSHLPGRELRRCSLVWAIAAPLRRGPLLPLGGVAAARRGVRLESACGPQDLRRASCGSSSVGSRRRALPKKRSAIVPSAVDEERLRDGAHAVRAGRRSPSRLERERPRRVAARSAKLRASLSMSW